jgi:hypothetical protein
MTQQINIDKNEAITISNSTFGDITITLNDVGEYVIVSNGPPVAVQQTTVDGGFKQQYSGNGKSIKQTAFSNLKVDGDLILGNISQSIR